MTDSLETYRQLARIRRFEEACVELKAAGEIQGSMHLCNGQEAIPVGACRVLRPEDSLSVTYRGHGWAIARGIPLASLFAELMGRDSDLCGGRGGSAYFSSAAHNFLGENSIVGAGVPIAAGAALASHFRRDATVSLVSIGDGAVNQGSVHEALTFAAVMRLPLVVVIENNGYAELTPAAAMIPTETIAERSSAYGIAAARVDGNDADTVEAAVASAVDHARGGAGPYLIEALTERIVGHYDLDPQHYRPRGEVEAALTREPLARLRPRLDAAAVAGVDDEVEAEIGAAVAAAQATPFPPASTATEHVYA